METEAKSGELVSTAAIVVSKIMPTPSLAQKTLQTRRIQHQLTD